MNDISIVIPTLNEAGNVGMLADRIASSFENSGINYEIIFVDDHSTDNTAAEIAKLTTRYPVRFIEKDGPRGKAFSLIQGFKNAHYNTICMIDADLQYPPEAIVPMYQLLQSSGSDVVLTERVANATSTLRKIASSGYNFVFTRLLFGFDYDTQSGLKLFRKSVINRITLNPTPWSFDLEFIVRALEQNCKIISYQIPFAERYSGEAKVQVVKVSYELAKASLGLRFHTSASKVKRAYRMNLEFAEKALTTLLVASVLALGGMLAQPMPADALDLQALKAKADVPKVVQKVTELLPNVNAPSLPDDSTTDPSSNAPSTPTNPANDAAPASQPESSLPVVGGLTDPIIQPVVNPVSPSIPVPNQPVINSALTTTAAVSRSSTSTATSGGQAGSNLQVTSAAATATPTVRTANVSLASATLSNNQGDQVTYPNKSASSTNLYASAAAGRYQNLVAPLLRVAAVVLLTSILIVLAMSLTKTVRRRNAGEPANG